MGLSGDSALSPDILCLKHACSILRQTPNPVAEVLHKKPSVVGRRSLATNRSLVLMLNGLLSLVTVGREDQQRTHTNDITSQLMRGVGAVKGRRAGEVQK